MGLLLRQGKKSVWSGAPPDEQRRADALTTFQRTERDTDGLSVYEVNVENKAERELVIAAIASARGHDDPIDLLEISREEIERYGPITPTEGETPLRAANRLHRSLDWDAATLERLANALFQDRRAARRITRPEVRAALLTIEVEDVEGDEAKAFVKAHHQRKPKV